MVRLGVARRAQILEFSYFEALAMLIWVTRV